MVIFSTLVKVAVQVELARWTISTGQLALTGYNKVPPKLGPIGWVNLLWVVMALSKVLQIGGIVGGVAVALSIMFPLGGDPLGGTSLAIWTIIVAVGSIALLYSNRYSLIERGAVLLVVVFSIVTILIALWPAVHAVRLRHGRHHERPHLAIPAGALGVALAMFGITGVGADEITFYTYWCVEKGYARYVGPNDGSDAWARRARGWISVMYKDAFVSWIIYTFGTLAFFIMGAAVLHPQGLVPEGNEMITTLSRMYTDTLGALGEHPVPARRHRRARLDAVGRDPELGADVHQPAGRRSGWWTGMTPSTRLRWIRIFTVALPNIAPHAAWCPSAGARIDRRRHDRQCFCWPRSSPSGTCAGPRSIRGSTAAPCSTRVRYRAAIAAGRQRR